MAQLKKHKTIRQALLFVSDNPEWPSDLVTDRFEMSVWEMTARNLFDIANHPDTSSRTKMAQATRAQKIILDRLSGTRRQGTHPAVKSGHEVEMRDLTGGISNE